MVFARRKVELTSSFHQDMTSIFHCACVDGNFLDDRLENCLLMKIRVNGTHLLADNMISKKCSSYTTLANVNEFSNLSLKLMNSKI